MGNADTLQFDRPSTQSALKHLRLHGQLCVTASEQFGNTRGQGLDHFDVWTFTIDFFQSILGKFVRKREYPNRNPGH